MLSRSQSNKYEAFFFFKKNCSYCFLVNLFFNFLKKEHEDVDLLTLIPSEVISHRLHPWNKGNGDEVELLHPL